MSLLDQLASVSEGFSEALVVIDTDFTFRAFNSEATRVLGVRAPEADPTKWSEQFGVLNGMGFLHYSKLPLIRALRGERIHGEILLLKNIENPEGFCIRCNANPLYEDSKLVGALMTFVRLGKERTSTQTIMSRFRAWTEATPDLMAVLSADGHLVDLVSGKGVPTSNSPSEYIGKHLTDITSPEIAAVASKKAEEALTSGEIVVWHFKMPERQNLNYEARFLRTLNNECLVLVRDITGWVQDQQLLEEEIQKRTADLQSSNDELRQFAYTASHDLREPLGKIKAFGARLDEKYSDVLDERGAEYLSVMLSATVRMTSLIDDLLEYSRLGKERTCEPVAVSSVLRDVVGVLSEKLDGATVHFSEALPILRADKQQVNMLFQNLLSNSLKFRHPNHPCEIFITHTSTSRHHIFKVMDNGIGFDQDYAGKIFQVFERLHTRFDFPGTGIGLALCKKIMDQHGGYIHGEGVPDQGATFWIGFPKEQS